MRKREVLQLKVEGPGVRPGGITIPDLLLICQQAQTAVNRQAEALEGRQTIRRGPKIAKAHLECTLELVKLRRGSTTLGFVIAKPQRHLPTMTSFGEEVIAGIVTTVKSLAETRGKPKLAIEPDPGVLDSLKTMGEVFEMKSVSSIKWIIPGGNGNKRTIAVYNKAVRDRVAERLKPPSQRLETVEGMLEMADFKETDQKCRIHPSVGNPVACTFDKDKSDEIYAALRHPARIKGQATVNAQTGRVESIHVEELRMLQPLLMGAYDFFAAKSISELAQAQGVKPLADVSILAGGWPDEEDLDETLDEIYRQREM